MTVARKKSSVAPALIPDDEDSIEEKIRGRVKRVVRNMTGKRSVVEVHAHIVKKAA